MLLNLLVVNTEATEASGPSVIIWQQKAWVSHRGENLSLHDSLVKSPDGVWVALAYSSCPTLCPLTGQRLKSLDDELQTQKLQLPMILISIDPDQETPKSLREWMQKQGVLRDHWTFLKSNLELTRKLAGAIQQGFGDHKSETHLSHTSRLTWIKLRSKAFSASNLNRKNAAASPSPGHTKPSQDETLIEILGDVEILGGTTADFIKRGLQLRQSKPSSPKAAEPPHSP
ncbi:MAG TPA: SCO family protein [Pseudobdellovibrionaceae bacterium]|nr:SCO family protein [Pseudobdellovibrionaceae bacterium]